MHDRSENLKFPLPPDGIGNRSADQPPSQASKDAVGGMPFTEQILEVSRIAQTRLARMANVDAKTCQLSYLFRDQHFCGIRYRANQFTAIWQVNEPEIAFFRGQTPVGMVELASEQRRAA